MRKKLARSQVLPTLEKLTPCLIGMEACGSSHYWARELQALGYEVRLMPAQYVKAYVKRNKTDAADVEAICEASKIRLRPILMTTLTTVVGMLPLAMALGKGSEMLQPLAVTIISGLIFSTLVSLLLVPIMYQLLGKEDVS